MNYIYIYIFYRMIVEINFKPLKITIMRKIHTFLNVSEFEFTFYYVFIGICIKNKLLLLLFYKTTLHCELKHNKIH